MEEMNMAANTEVSEGIATPIETTEVIETPGEQTETEVQGEVTQTQAFSKRLNEVSSKFKERQDAFARKYGYSSFEELEQAEAEREAEERNQQLREQIGVDPDTLKPVFEEWKKSDPVYQEANKIIQERNIKDSIANLNSELKEAGLDLQLKDLSEEEYMKIPNADKVTEYVQKGHSLADAFFLANKKDIISKKSQAVEQETIKKIIANGTSSPGSLANNGDSMIKSVSQMSSEEFNNLIERVRRGEKIRL